MTRWISVVADTADGVQDVTWLVARAIDGTLADRLGSRCLKVSGGGMDMGFHVVYSLSTALHGDGYAVSQRWL